MEGSILQNLGAEWALAFAATACVIAAVYAAYRFFQKPTEEQIAAVKEWLLWAVTEAERELGAGTGRLKLRQAYDLFIQRFPAVSRYVPFETFSGWVDEALEQMKKLLATNAAVKDYVCGEQMANAIANGGNR